MSRRVIVSFVGGDLGLIMDGIRKQIPLGIDKIYLLYDKKEDVWGKMSRENVDFITKKVGDLIEVVKVGINPRDYEGIFKSLYEIIDSESGEDIEINIDITSTTRIGVAVAVAIATMFGAKVYTVSPEYYFPPNKIKVLDESKDYVELLRKRRGRDIIDIPLPVQPIKKLSKKERDILLALFRSGGAANSLRELLNAMGLSVNDKNKADLSYRLRVLERRGCIERKKNKTLKVYLTRFGATLTKVLEKGR
ncbi:MAG: HFX_2341 family transcriptional regulator domain-containing protein [Candidatus Asgardarchaeia archaeon]